MKNYTYWKNTQKKIAYCIDIFTGGLIVFSGVIIYLSKYGENYNISIDL